MANEALYHRKKSKIYYGLHNSSSAFDLVAHCREPPSYSNFRNYFRVILIDYIEQHTLFFPFWNMRSQAFRPGNQQKAWYEALYMEKSMETLWAS